MLGDDTAQTLGNDERDLQRRLGQHDDEFLAAIAGDEIEAANMTRDARGDFLQHGIAGLMAVAVIDALEPVDIEEQRRL